jgi:hypothetical protein
MFITRTYPFFWLLFFGHAKTNSSGMNLCCEADP